jgi:hypothetical protein
MGCCLLGFVFGFIVLIISAEVIPTRLTGATAYLDYLGFLLAVVFLYVLAARIVHGKLQTRISNMDRALGLPLGLARGLGVVVSPMANSHLLPDRHAASYQFLVGLIDMMPFVWVVGLFLVPSVLADLIAAATRSWRLRRAAAKKDVDGRDKPGHDVG